MVNNNSVEVDSTETRALIFSALLLFDIDLHTFVCYYINA